MKFNIQHVSVKENLKDWSINAFDLYKQGMLSHTVVYIVGFLVLASFMSLLSDNMRSIFFLLSFIFIAPYLLIYMFGLIYKKDKNAPDFKNIDFSSNTLKRFFRYQIYFLLFLLFVGFISAGIGNLLSGISESEASENSFFTYNLYDYLTLTGSYIFRYAHFMIFFAYFVIYMFCDKTISQTSQLFNEFFIVKMNYSIILFSFLIPTVVFGVIHLLPDVFKVLYIAIIPYFMSWHYVVFKHAFFGMTPEKQEEKERVDSHAYHMT